MQHISKENGMHVMEKCYTEKMFYTTHTVHLADNKTIWTLSSFLKLFFGQNPPGTDRWAWMTCLCHECSLKGRGTHKWGRRSSRLALGWPAQRIALGKQGQAVSSHTAGTPQQDTYLVHSSDTALFKPAPLHFFKGGAESSPTKLASCHSLTATPMTCCGDP